MQVPPVPQIQNDLLRPQAGSGSPSSVAETLSKNTSQDSKTRFSDHLNDERRLSSNAHNDRTKKTELQKSSAEKTSSASESSRQSDPEDGALETESQAEIAESSQEVPSEPSEGSPQTKTSSDAEDPDVSAAAEGEARRPHPVLGWPQTKPLQSAAAAWPYRLISRAGPPPACAYPPRS